MDELSVHFRTCQEPASAEPHVWPDDITRWPVSRLDYFSLVLLFIFFQKILIKGKVGTEKRNMRLMLMAQG